MSPPSSVSQDVQARFEKSLKDAKSIGSVEIEILDTFWLSVGDFSRTFEYSYIASGVKYRAACKLISGSQTNLVRLSKSAFDGNSYSSYDEDMRYMARRNDNPPGDRALSPFNPLIAPFMFLTRQSDECGPCMLRFTDIISDKWTNGFVLPSGQLSGDLLEISMPGLRLNKQATIWKITIDKAGDSFSPKMIRTVAPGVEHEVVYRFLNYTNLRTYQFPTKIEWARSSYPPSSPPTVLATGLVTVISARIPDQIADSVFRLDGEEKSAATIYNWEQRKLTKTDPKLAAVQARRSTARNVLLSLLLLTALVIPILAGKKFASKNKRIDS
jgi:hypothetical protein